MGKTAKDKPAMPGAGDPGAFMAAILAAQKNDDSLAAAILRDMAESMMNAYKPKSV